jgi:transcriptional regulator with XRE-family HTH domain
MINRTNYDLKVLLASRIRAERKKQKLSQEKFAQLADIPIRTYKRFEQNCSGGFDNFINILRVLNKLELIEEIFPPPKLTNMRSVSDILKELNKNT